MFRIRIHHEREVLLVASNQAQGLSTPSLPGVDLTQLQNQLVEKPLHSGAFITFSTRFPAFGDCVRLCSRWLHAHMLGDRFGHELLEYLVASLFLSPEP